MCVCVSASVWIFLSFFKNAVLFVSVCHGSIAVSDFFSAVLEHLKLQERNSLNVILLNKQA